MNNKKTSMWRLFSGLALVVAMGITSCAKDGEVGPKGENGVQGPQGTPGAQGPAGPAGAQGAPGTANVYYSAWTDVTFQGVDASSPADGIADYFGAQITAPRLVDSIINKGEVKVYLNVNTSASPTIIALPTYDPALGFWVNTYFQTSKIIMYASENLSTATVTGGAKAQQYRYIIIPGGTTGRTNINWNDYAQVKAYLNLKD